MSVARAVLDALLVAVALVLAEHGVAGLDRPDRAQDLQPLGAQLVAGHARRGVHQREREQLQQVVLADVAQRARRVVEVAAAVDAAVLGDGDLDRLDRAAVPERLEDAVDEAQDEQVLRRLLAEVVVDPQQLLLVEVLVQRGAQLARAGEVLAERLLDHQARGGSRLAAEPDPGQLRADLGEQRRRDGEVGEAVALALVERLLQPLVELGVVGGAVDHLGRLEQLLPALAALQPRAAGPVLGGQLAQLLGGGRARDAEHGELLGQPAGGGQVVEGGPQLAPGEVAGGPEQHERHGSRHARQPPPSGRVACMTRSRHTRRGGAGPCTTT